MPGGLVEDLTAWRLRNEWGRGDPVFVNRQGRRQTVRNVEARIKTAIRHANQRLSELGIEPISEKVTPHSLRRTYASLRFALRDDLVYVSDQLGHAEPAFSIKVYARAVRRREKLSGAYLAEYDRALDWARIGTNGGSSSANAAPAERREAPGLAQ